jgi:hypothetical protein
MNVLLSGRPGRISQPHSPTAQPFLWIRSAYLPDHVTQVTEPVGGRSGRHQRIVMSASPRHLLMTCIWSCINARYQQGLWFSRCIHQMLCLSTSPQVLWWINEIPRSAMCRQEGCGRIVTCIHSATIDLELVLKFIESIRTAEITTRGPPISATTPKAWFQINANRRFGREEKNVAWYLMNY